MLNCNRDFRRVLLLSPYPENIKHSIEEYGDHVDILNRRITSSFIKSNSYDFIISFGYSHILDENTINYVGEAAINLHISYLPFNKGAHPNVWSNFEKTISGVSIHLMDKGLDTGNILFQKEIYINKKEHTFLSSYLLLIWEIEKLFKLNWKYLRTNESNGWNQIGEGSFHYEKDLEIVKPHLKLGWETNIQDALNSYEKNKKVFIK